MTAVSKTVRLVQAFNARRRLKYFINVHAQNSQLLGFRIESDYQ